ncbi:MAG: serine/threonine-protein kinase [Planctomycetota bacterium]
MSVNEPTSQSPNRVDDPSTDQHVLQKRRSLPIRELADELLLEQQDRSAAGCPVALDSYFVTFPQLREDESIAVDLIYNDFLLRSTPDNRQQLQQETLNRFPEFANTLERQFEVFDALNDDAGVSCPLNGDVDDSRKTNLQRCLDSNRFELNEMIGEGTFALVYGAWDRSLKRSVAVKFAKLPFDGPSVERERFQREAAAAAGMAHPGIVSVYEFGNSEDHAFMVQEFVPGGTLKERIHRGDYSKRQAANWVCKLAEAIDYAHRYGVVHRDIKPANILFDDRDEPKIADFGLAALADQESQLTRHGDLIGTPAYMSPEQAMGESAVISSDVYSLGVVLFELLVGKPPFQGPVSSVIEQVIHREPEFGRSRQNPIPNDLKVICLKAMAKSAEDRYQNAQELALDLRRYLLDEPIRAKQIGVWEKTIRWFARQPALVATICLATVLLFVGGALAIINIQKERQKFQHQRDIANGRLFESLLKSAETNLRTRHDGWYESAFADLQKAAAMDEAENRMKPIHELLAEMVCDDSFRICVDTKWIGPKHPISAISCGSQWNAIGYEDGSLRLIDNDIQDVYCELAGPTGAIERMEWVSHSRLLAMSQGKLWAWTIPESPLSNATQPETQTIPSHQFCVVRDSSTTRQNVIVASQPGRLDVLDLESMEFIDSINTETKFRILALDGQSDRLIASFEDHSVRVFDLVTKKAIQQFRSDDPSIAVAHDGSNHLMWTTKVSYATDAVVNDHPPKRRVFHGAPFLLKPFQHTQLKMGVIVGSDDGSITVCDWSQNRHASRRMEQGLTCLSVDPVDLTRFLIGNDQGVLTQLSLTKGGVAKRFPTVHAVGVDRQGRMIIDGMRIDPVTMKVQPIRYNVFASIDAGKHIFAAAGTTTGDLVFKPDVGSQTVSIKDAHPAAIEFTEIGFEGRSIVTADGLGTIHVWDANSQRRIAESSIADRTLTALVAHEDSEHVVIATDQGIGIFNNPTSENSNVNEIDIQWLDLEAANVQLDLNADRLMIAFDRSLQVFDLAVTGELSMTSPIFQTELDPSFRSARFSPDGETLYVLNEQSLERHSLGEPKISQINNPSAMSVAIDPAEQLTVDTRGEFVTTNSSLDGILHFFDAETLAPLVRVHTRSSTQQELCFLNNGDLGIGNRGMIRLERRMIENGLQQKLSKEHIVDIDYRFKIVLEGDARAARWSAVASNDGRWLAFGRHYRNVEIVDAVNMELARLLDEFPQEVWATAFSGDSKWFAAGSEQLGDSTHGVLRVYNTEDWTMRYETEIANRLIAGLDFHPTLPILAISSFDGSLSLVQAENGKLLKQLLPSQAGNRQNSLATMDVSFSPDGKWLAVTRKSEGGQIWPVVAGSESANQVQRWVGDPVTLKIPGQRIWALAFDSTSKRLAFASESGQINLFSVDEAEHLLTIRSGCPRLRNLVFTPDNRFLIGSAWTSQGVIIDLQSMQTAMSEMGSQHAQREPVFLFEASVAK